MMSEGMNEWTSWAMNEIRILVVPIRVLVVERVES
jgi:hypothetical protein